MEDENTEYIHSSAQSPRAVEYANSSTPQSSVVRARLTGHVDATFDSLTVPLTRKLIAEAPDIIRDASEDNFEDFQRYHHLSDLNSSLNSQEEGLVAPNISTSSNRGTFSPQLNDIPEHRSSTDDSHRSGASQLRSSQAEVSSSLQHYPRQAPLSLDSGYTSGQADIHSPSRLDGVGQHATNSATSQISLDQSRLDELIDIRVNAVLQDRLSQFFSSTLVNSNLFPARQDHTAGQTTRQELGQAAEQRVTEECQRNVPQPELNTFQPSIALVDTAQMTSSQTMPFHGNNGMTDGLNSDIGFEFENLSSLFDFISPPVNEGPA